MRSGDRYEQECQPEFGQTVFCRYTGTLKCTGTQKFLGRFGIIFELKKPKKADVSGEF